MDGGDYQAAVLSVVMAARMLLQHDLDAVLAAIDRAGAIGPLLDPTLYREKGQAMQEDRELLMAAKPLWDIGKKLTSLRSRA